MLGETKEGGNDGDTRMSIDNSGGAATPDL
jgi:hypothetical protein